MEINMGNIERRKKIMQIIYRRGYDTIPNLAAEFGVSTRTLQRDIELLSLYEPIYTKNGRYGGGIYLLDSYVPEKTYLGPDETELLESIVSQAEKKGSCSLSKDQIRNLKNIISTYSDPKIS